MFITDKVSQYAMDKLKSLSHIMDNADSIRNKIQNQVLPEMESIIDKTIEDRKNSPVSTK